MAEIEFKNIESSDDLKKLQALATKRSRAVSRDLASARRSREELQRRVSNLEESCGEFERFFLSKTIFVSMKHGNERGALIQTPCKLMLVTFCVRVLDKRTFSVDVEAFLANNARWPKHWADLTTAKLVFAIHRRLMLRLYSKVSRWSYIIECGSHAKRICIWEIATESRLKRRNVYIYDNFVISTASFPSSQNHFSTMPLEKRFKKCR